jgi:hypothetical protein
LGSNLINPRVKVPESLSFQAIVDDLTARYQFKKFIEIYEGFVD